MTYGPSGIEYTATCSVSTPHTVITCATAPGTGRVNYWLVTVGGQISTRSTGWTSYAAPSITSISPATGPTTGGQTLSIVGANFGLKVASSRLVVKINNLQAARPTPARWAAYRTQKLAGAATTTISEVEAWVGSLYSAPIITAAHGATNDTVTVAVPPGYGSRAEIIVLVDGVPSDWTTAFSYNPPYITNLAPDRTNLTIPGTLHVWIDGSSFCSGAGACGSVLFNGAAPQYPIPFWSDSLIEILVTDPGSETIPNSVVVVVGDQQSNNVTFLKPVPNFNAVVQPGVRTGMSTRGNESFSIINVADVGQEPCNITIGGSLCTGLKRFVDNGYAISDSRVRQRRSLLLNGLLVSPLRRRCRRRH